MSSAARPVYDCDTSGYWCSEEDFHAREKRYGQFIEEGAAYEITDRNTPRPWLNYLCNDRFGSVISNTGLGFSWYKTLLLRITKYDHPVDYLPRQFEDGRMVLVEDLESGEKWNHFQDAENVKCVHRPGSTTLTAEHNGIAITMTVFVAWSDAVELSRIEIRNASETSRRLRVACEQKWTFSRFGIHTAEEGIPYLSTPGKDMDVSAVANAVLARTWNKELPMPLWGLFLSPELLSATVRDEHVVRRNGRRFTFKVCRLAAEWSLGRNETRTVHTASGAEDDEERFLRMSARYISRSSYADEENNVRENWKRLRDYPSCELPEPDLQNFLNVWLKNQLFLTFRFIRSGFVGFRDTLQDTWGYSLLDPARARAALLRTMAHIKRDGVCPRNYSIVDDRHDLRAFMDSGTWIGMAVADYVKETGDLAILDQRIPWLDDASVAPVREHIKAALDLLFERRGRFGFCLAGDGDWNDALEGISRSGAAVSAWLTMALYHAQNILAELFRRAGDAETGATYLKRSAELRRALHEHAWDGSWYVYGFTGSGQPIGSKSNREGRIHLNSQTWAIFTGLATPDQIELIRAAIAEHLDTPLGPALLAPPYVEDAEEVGRIARLEPGTFENGAVYQHAVTFKIYADIAVGAVDDAVTTFRNLLPTNPENFDARRTSEPYCTGNYYCGPGHPRFGQNFFSWFTGNAAWLLRAAYDHILGVSAEYDGLRIDPKVPASWNRFTVRKKYRGGVYTIEFERATTGEERGIWLDGVRLSGPLIPVTTSGEKAIVVKYG